MEPIRGTNVSLEMALIAAKAAEIRDQVNIAGARLVLDSQRTAGREIVEMLETLGTLIDTYV